MSSIKEMVASLRCDNILECFFGLNELDSKVYELLLRGVSTNQEIAKAVNKSENAVYKSLQKLMMCGLVKREKKSVESGGYYYIYKAVSPKEVAENIRKEVNLIVERILKAVNEFEKSWIVE